MFSSSASSETSSWRAPTSPCTFFLGADFLFTFVAAFLGFLNATERDAAFFGFILVLLFFAAMTVTSDRIVSPARIHSAHQLVECGADNTSHLDPAQSKPTGLLGVHHRPFYGPETRLSLGEAGIPTRSTVHRRRLFA